MAIPLMILAGCTVLIGLICLVAWPFTGGPAEWFAGHLEKTLAFESLGHEEHGFSWMTAIIGTLVGVGGIGLSYVMYAQPSPWPATAEGAVPAALRGLAAQVLRRRDLSMGRGGAAPRLWPSSATSWTRTWWIGW